MKRDTLSDHGYRFPPRHDQPRRLAVSPLRCERARCRRSPGPTRHDGVLRSDPAVVPHGSVQSTLAGSRVDRAGGATSGTWTRSSSPSRDSGAIAGVLSIKMGTSSISSSRRVGDYRAAPRLFRKLLKGQERTPGAGGHRQAAQRQGLRTERSCRPVAHRTDRDENNRAGRLPPAHTATRATHAPGHISRAGTTIRCPCMDSSATSSALAVTWCERCIIGSYRGRSFLLWDAVTIAA